MLNGEEYKWQFKEIISYDLETGIPTYGSDLRPITEEDVLKLNTVLNRYNINTPNRIAHFLAQCDIECGKGGKPVEKYNGDNIFKYFEKYEKSDNKLGNTQPGDGTLFRGGGAIQMTGRDAYKEFATAMGDEKILSDGALYVAQNYFWESAGYYWSIYKPSTASDDRFNLNKKCDDGKSVEEITGIIKGSSADYLIRQMAYEYYISQLTGTK